jgi:hypothetical protein
MNAWEETRLQADGLLAGRSRTYMLPQHVSNSAMWNLIHSASEALDLYVYKIRSQADGPEDDDLDDAAMERRLSNAESAIAVSEHLANKREEYWANARIEAEEQIDIVLKVARNKALDEIFRFFTDAMLQNDIVLTAALEKIASDFNDGKFAADLRRRLFPEPVPRVVYWVPHPDDIPF